MEGEEEVLATLAKLEALPPDTIPKRRFFGTAFFVCKEDAINNGTPLSLRTVLKEALRFYKIALRKPTGHLPWY